MCRLHIQTATAILTDDVLDIKKKNKQNKTNP